MATAEEGGGAANNASSSYAGGGAGGKFRKQPFRRQSTPYDRPLTALRGTNTTSNTNAGSWLTKLVVDPASKLISYGTDRIFASVFRKRLPPPELPEVKNDASERAQGVIGNDQDNMQEPTNGSFKSNGTFELEQLLKQKTFSRFEVVRLTELLQSRAVVEDISNGDVGQKNVESALPFARHEQFDRGPLEKNKKEGTVSSTIISTPVSNSKVCKDAIASPAELAKAYMGSRPSKVSPSMLGMHYQGVRDDTAMFSSVSLTSKSPNMSLVKKASTSVNAPENRSITPRSRGRSAIYSMARTPYSRFNTTSTQKGSGSTGNGNAGPSVSRSRTLMDHDEKFEPQAMTLKRRSSVLDDDDIGSVGPIRRIRQKSNLLAPRVYHTAHGGRIDHHTKQKLELTGKPENKASKSVMETEKESGPSTSYAHVPFKSSEVAARILQNLEKLTPKEKSLESKLMSMQEKSPLKLTPGMLSGRALRSMEDIDSSKLLVDGLKDDKLGSIHNYASRAGGESSSPKPKEVEENGPEGSIVPSYYSNPVISEDSTASLRASGSSAKTTDAVVDNGSPQPLQKKRAFRMSAHEVSLEQDDDGGYDEITPALFSEKVSSEAPRADGNFAPIDISKSVKTSIQPEMNPSSCFASSSENGLGSLSSVSIGDGGSGVVFPASEQDSATARQPVCPSSVAAFDKPTETNNHNPLLNFSSKVADRFPGQPSDSGNGAEDNLESSRSLLGVPASIGSQVKAPELDTTGNLNQKARDLNGKSVTDPSLKWSPPSGLAISSADRNEIYTNGIVQLTSSTSISNLSPLGNSMNDTISSSGSMFGLIEKPPISAGPVFKFGATVDPVSAVSAASGADTGIADLGAKAEINPISSSSSSSLFSVTALTAVSPGSSTSELGSLTSHSTGSNLQGSLFSGVSKSLVFGAGAAVAQGTSASPQSSTGYGCTSSSSQLSIPGSIFGVNSSETMAGISGSMPKSNEFKFGESRASSVAAPVISSSGAPANVFGFNASSPSATTVGLSSSALLPKFGFGGSSISASAATTCSSLLGCTSEINSGGSSSTSAVTSVSSGDDPGLFNWQSPKSSVFGSGASSTLPSTGISFSTSSTSAPISSSPVTALTFGASTTSAAPASTGFSFGLSSSSAAAPSPSTAIAFGASPSSSALMPSSSTAGFSFGASSTSSIPASSPSPPALFSFGASSTSTASVPSPSAGFSFGSSSTPSASSNAAPLVFNSSSAASSSPFFSFTAASASALSSPSLPINQPVFGSTPVGGFAAPCGNNNDQMNAEDSMAEDPVLSSLPPPVFGQPSAAFPSPPGFTFGSAVPSQPNPFMFAGQQNQVALQNPSPFQSSGSLAGGSFSLGSGDKSTRKIVKINRNKNRKK